MAASAPVFTPIDSAYPRPGAATAWLLEDLQEVAFIDPGTTHALPLLLGAPGRASRKPTVVRWVIVTHADLDVSGSVGALLEHFPSATLLCHPDAVASLIDPTARVASALEAHGAEGFERRFGTVAPVAADRIRAMDEKAAVKLGKRTLRFLHAPGHAADHLIVRDERFKNLFTGDAFGRIYPFLQRAGRFALASTGPSTFDHAAAIKTLDRLTLLKPTNVCLTRSGYFPDFGEISRQVRAWWDRSKAAVDACPAGLSPAEATTWLRARLDESLAQVTAQRGLLLTDEERAFLSFDLDESARGLARAVALRNPG